MAKDPWQDPGAKAWIAHTHENLTPKLRASRIFMAVTDDNPDPDIRFCVEIGMAIMMDKPIMAVVKPGVRVPDHLVRVADLIVECNMESEEDRTKLMDAMEAFTKKYKHE